MEYDTRNIGLLIIVGAILVGIYYFIFIPISNWYNINKDMANIVMMIVVVLIVFYFAAEYGSNSAKSKEEQRIYNLPENVRKRREIEEERTRIYNLPENVWKRQEIYDRTLREVAEREAAEERRKYEIEIAKMRDKEEYDRPENVERRRMVKEREEDREAEIEHQKELARIRTETEREIREMENEDVEEDEDYGYRETHVYHHKDPGNKCSSRSSRSRPLEFMDMGLGRNTNPIGRIPKNKKSYDPVGRF